MGIAGLSSDLESFAVYKTQAFLNDGILYIDGMNLIGGTAKASSVKASTKADYIERAIKAIQAKIGTIKKLPWKKIYMFVDAYFPVEKIDVKIRRKKNGIWNKPSVSAMSEIMRYIINDEPSIEFILSGLEGETAIVQHIYENRHDKTSKRFILSEDTDIYTFDLPMKNLIYGMPLNQLSPHIRAFKLLQFASVWSAIPDKHKVKLPLTEIPESVFNPYQPIRSLVESLNLIASHNELTVFMAPFATRELTGAYEIGLPYRKAKYRALVDEYFHGRQVPVVEYVEKDFTIIKRTEVKANDEEWAEVVQGFMTLPLETLVYNEFKRVQKEIGFSNKEVNSIYAFVADCTRGKCETGMAPSFRTFQAKALLEALAAAMSSLKYLIPIGRDFSPIVQVSEFKLCKYIV